MKKTRQSTTRTARWLPCRIDDRAAPELLVTVLGTVDTSLCQALFNPATDVLLQNTGKVLKDYYRKHLGVTSYQPATTAFADPPGGWCSWGYYCREITPAEVLVNARWLAQNLAAYGLTLVLLDDGWQAGGRDWTGVRDSFRNGMKWLADEIRKLGLMPGLWLCPHGQENEAVMRAAGCFMLEANGKPVATFFGGVPVDPTHPKTPAYLRRLIRGVTREWGYEYLKMDGIPSLVELYRQQRHRFHDPGTDAVQAAQRTFAAIRHGAGRSVFLAGCAGLPLETIGFFDAQRTGADVDAEWRAFGNAVDATMRGLYLHRIAWYSDPDYCLLRPPLSLEMARAWATLHGMTGQLLYLGDRLPDLAPERVKLIKKIAPAAPIRPFDLFPAEQHKPLFDLKVNHRGRAYDVVAAFNYDDRVPTVVRVDFAKMGLDPARRWHVYDFWAGDYLGLCDVGVFVEVPAAACRVLTVCPEGDFPVLLSTDRHITQGWPDIEAFDVSRPAQALSGASRVMAGEPYTLTFGLPNDGTRTFALKKVTVSGERQVHTRSGRGVAQVTWRPRRGGLVQWRVEFERVPMILPLGTLHSFPFMLGARDIDPWTVELYWISFGSPAGFFIRQDGRLLGYAFGNKCRVGGLTYGQRCEFEIGVADLDGRRATRTGHLALVAGAALPRPLHLSDLAWESATSGYWAAKSDKTVSGAELSTAGRRYRKGIGTHPTSRLVYRLRGLFVRLDGAVGIADQNGIPPGKPAAESGQALFSVRADGGERLAPVRKLYGERATPFSINVSGVDVLELLVEHPAGVPVSLAPHANWLDLELTLGKLRRKRAASRHSPAAAPVRVPTAGGAKGAVT